MALSQRGSAGLNGNIKCWNFSLVAKAVRVNKAQSNKMVLPYFSLLPKANWNKREELGLSYQARGK